MDDLDRKLYDIFSMDNMRKRVADLKNQQENAETDDEKNTIAVEIAEWEKILNLCENKKE